MTDALGIFIGGGRWEVAHVKASFARARLAGNLTVTEGTDSERAARVRDYIRGAGLESPPISVAIQDSALRIIEVPAGNEADLKSAIGFEMERHLPSAAIEAEYCWTIAERKKGVFSVLAATAPKRGIDGVAGAFREAGCGEVSVLPRAAALSETLKASGEETDGACVLTVGGNIGHIDFYENAFPCSSISVPSNADLNGAMEAVLANRSRLSGRATRMILCSGPFDLSSKSAPVRRLDSGWGPASPVAFGAALSVLRDGPMFFRKKRREGAFQSSLLGYATAALMAFSIISLPLRDRYDLWRVERKISALAEESSASREAAARLREARRAIDSLERIKGGTLARLDLLKALTEAATADTHLTLFDSRADNEVVLEGLSRDASSFFLKLEGSSAFDEVELLGPVTRSDGMERFRMKAKAAPHGRGAKG